MGDGGRPAGGQTLWHILADCARLSAGHHLCQGATASSRPTACRTSSEEHCPAVLQHYPVHRTQLHTVWAPMRLLFAAGKQ